MTNSHSRMRSQRRLPVFRKCHELFHEGQGGTPQSKAFIASKLSPTFSGALEWIKRNCEVINTILRLLQIYPNLIQDESLDSLWEFLQPFMESGGDSPPLEDREQEGGGRVQTGTAAPEKRNELNVINFSQRRRSSESCPSRQSYNRTTLFVCGSISDGNVNIAGTNTERIVAALSPYSYVRSNPPRLQGPFSEVCRNVTSADAFIFVMNDKSLTNDVCIHHLGAAVAFDVPVVVVREAGFTLPRELPEQFYRTEIVKKNRCKSPVKISSEVGHFTDSGELESSRMDDNASVDVDTSSQQTLLLSEVIHDCFESSLVYVPTFHDSCIGKLFGKLSDYLGDLFLDLEVTRSNRFGSGQASSSVLRPISDMNATVFRNRQSVPTAAVVDFDGTNHPKEVGVKNNNTSMLRTTTKRIDNDKNNLKLPPISNANLVAADVETLSTPPPQPVGDTQVKTTLVPILNPLNDNQSLSPVPVETNYLICPNRSYGNMSKDPFVVSFPAQLDILDNKVSDYLTSVSPTLTYVKLDFEYRSVASSPIRTPHATPTPRDSDRKPTKTLDTAVNNKTPSKAAASLLSQSHSRRQTPLGTLKRDNSDFRTRKVNRVRLAKPKSKSKDSMEISRVTLQYNVPAPIRQNSLR